MRHFTLFIFVFGLAASVYGASNVSQVEVEVEVPIEEGNRAEALQNAQKKAFKKALDTVLPMDIEAAERKRMLRNASRYIKSFRLLKQKEVGNKLQVIYRCAVILETKKKAGPLAPTRPSGYLVEIVWNPQRQNISASALLKFMKKELQMNVESFKLSRGSILTTIPVTKTPSQVQRKISRYLENKARVRIHEPRGFLPYTRPATP